MANYLFNIKNLTMYKYYYFMKLLIKSFLIIVFFISTAQSACNLIAEFGEKKEVFEKREIAARPFPMEYPELDIYPVLADDICPNERLKDVGIEYRFLNDELIAVNFVALNDDRNLVTEKLTLMNYVKKNYKKFDTGENPNAYEGVEVIEKMNLFVVYQRLTGDDGIKDEQIYISTPELDEKLVKFYAEKELGESKNSQWN